MSGPAAVADNPVVHAEGGDDCTKYPILVTAELLRELLTRAYGRGLTIEIKPKGSDGYHDLTVIENIDMSLVPSTDVVRSMRMEALLRQFVVADQTGGPNMAMRMHTIRAHARKIIPPFNPAEVLDEMLTPGWEPV